MRAIRFLEYGEPEEVLQLVECDRPVPGEKEILVKVLATAINDYDWSLVRGKPFLYRLIFGWWTPKRKIPGMELAGIVEAVGAKVSKFTIGDQVFGDASEHGFGTFAEYVCVNQDAVVKKPEKVGFEEAVSIPHAGALAFQGLKDQGGLEQGQSVLINGGGGGVGAVAVQLAKHYHCSVDGVDSSQKQESMKSWGYDEVFDYQKTDLTRLSKKYDLVLDCKTNRVAFDYLKILKPKGKYITIGGHLDKLILMLLLGRLLGFFTGKKLAILGLKINKDLDAIIDFYEKNIFRAHYEGPYQLEEIPKLIQHFGNGNHIGKIVVKV